MMDLPVYLNAKDLSLSIWRGKWNFHLLKMYLEKKETFISTHLVTINFMFSGRCTSITDVGVIAITEGCTSLEFLR